MNDCWRIVGLTKLILPSTKGCKRFSSEAMQLKGTAFVKSDCHSLSSTTENVHSE